MSHSSVARLQRLSPIIDFFRHLPKIACESRVTSTHSEAEGTGLKVSSSSSPAYQNSLCMCKCASSQPCTSFWRESHINPLQLGKRDVVECDGPHIHCLIHEQRPYMMMRRGARCPRVTEPGRAPAALSDCYTACPNLRLAISFQY